MRYTKASPMIRILLLVLAVSLLLCGCKNKGKTEPTEYTRPVGYEEHIVVALTDNFCVTNAAGKVLRFQNEKFTGDMSVMSYNAESSTVVKDSTELTVYLEETESFRFETTANYTYFMSDWGGARGYRISSIDVSDMDYSLVGPDSTYDAYLPNGCWKQMLIMTTGKGDLSVHFDKEADTMTITCTEEQQLQETNTGLTATIEPGTHTFTRENLFA